MAALPIGEPSPERLSFDEAQEKLGLAVTVFQDGNIIKISGQEEPFKAILQDLFTGLGSRIFPHEVEQYWSELRNGDHINPTCYVVFIAQGDKGGEKEGKFIMTVDAKNGRGYQPFLNDMRKAVEESIINAASR